MKLHRIALSNLGALYGAHEIDLDRSLDGAPLFLICGLTGSGKSTLLDAVCLALFGETPRLGRPATQEASALHTEDVRQIMSEGTDASFAELEWSRLVRGERVRYRARWRCQRSRSGQLSRLAPAVRTLECVLDTGVELIVESSRAREYKPAFESALGGFTLDSFLRSVLLAQGEFAAFLEATDRERAAILERLTGTERYQRIGARVRARHAEVEADFLAVQAEAEALGLAEDTSELEARIEAQEAEVRAARRELEDVEARISWVRQWVEFDREAGLTRRQLEAIEARGDFALLAAYERVEPHRPAYEARASARAALGRRPEADPARLEAARTRAAVLAKACEVRRTRARSLSEAIARGKADAERDRVRRELETEHRKAQARMLELDARIAYLAPYSDAAIEAVPELLAASEQCLSLEREALDAHDAADRALAGLTLEPTVDPATVLSVIAASSAELQRLAPDGPEALWAETHAAERARVELEEDLARLDAFDRARPARIAAKAQVQALEAEIGRLLEIETAHEAKLQALTHELDRSKLDARLERVRATLVDGAPCPVCGSLEHPGLQPTRQEASVRAELAEAMRARDQVRRDLERARRSSARAELEAVKDPAEDALFERLGDRDTAAEALLERRARLNALRQQTDALARALTERERALRTLEEAQRRANAVASARREAEAATARAAALETLVSKARAELCARLEGLGLASEAPDIVLSNLASALRNAGVKDRRVCVEVRAVEAARAHALEEALHAAAREVDPSAVPRGTDGAVPFDVEASVEPEGARLGRLETELRDAERALAESEETLAEANREAEARAVECRAAEAERTVELAKLEAAEAALVGVDEGALALLARLDPETAARMKAERVTYEAERAAFGAAYARAHERLSEVEARRPEGVVELDTLEATRDRLAERLGRALHALEETQTELSRASSGERAELRARLASAEHALAVHQRLYALVGEGDDLALFAQSLNLESLLRAANTHLAWVAPRYVLVASREGTGEGRLSFTVRDRSLGDVERSVRTLSRGESFLVALALALALAGFEASELKIETLLIDHGFGSLDGESLDRALEVVEHLRPSGVQVGLIGHVPELEARVSARIQLEAVGDGRSRIATQEARTNPEGTDERR